MATGQALIPCVHRGRRTAFVVALLFAASFAGAGPVFAERLRAFSAANYQGQERVYRDRVADLNAGEAAHAIVSVRVVTGRWLLCANANFSGDCAWLGHDVPSLPELGFKALPGSLRPERIPVILRNWGGRRPAPRESLVLFERADYDGAWTALPDSVPDFGAAHLTSPGSIVLGNGAWRLCTGVDYTGRCLIVTASAWDIPNVFFGRIQSAKRLSAETVAGRLRDGSVP